MNYQNLKKNITQVIKNKKDEDIINALVALRDSVINIEDIAKQLNISFDQLKKASDKNKKEKFDEKSLFLKIDELIVFEKEDDIISSLITLSLILSKTEAIIDDTPFNIEMVYKSLKKTVTETKEEPKAKEEVKENSEKEPVKKSEKAPETSDLVF